MEHGFHYLTNNFLKKLEHVEIGHDMVDLDAQSNQTKPYMHPPAPPIDFRQGW